MRFNPRNLIAQARAFSFSALPLKTRLGLIFAALMAFAILFSSVILFEQHRLAITGAEATILENAELEEAIRMKEALSSVHQHFLQGEISQDRADRFRDSLRQLQSLEAAPGSVALLENVQERFDSYAALINRPGAAGRQVGEARVRYEDVSAAVEAFIKQKQDKVYRIASEMRQKQERGIRTAVLFLTAFILVLFVCAMRIIAIVVEPLSGLSRFLDQLTVSGDLPARLPPIDSRVLEVSRVARSFERLFERLRGYQALNVRRLLMEKRRADVIAASIADGIFLLRGEEILYMNPIAERILSVPRGKSYKGVKLSSLSQEEKNAGASAVFTATSRTIPVDFEVETEQGKKSYLLQSLPISSEIIEQIEDSFPQTADGLMESWQANTLVLAQDVTLVRESQQAKSHFLATLSHEVKTPVTSLTMATRLLRKGVEQIPNPTYRALIQTCAEDVDRLRVLIDDLLSVSRFDTLTQKLEIQNVDVGKLLKQSVQYFQTQAFERGVEIVHETIPAGKKVMVPMDATKVSWALSNLMINALRHTPRGGRVEARVDAGSDEHVEVSIRDYGQGIEKNRQERIFDKFNPFYDLRVARSGSVGMGLAIAREIIIAHGGRIWVTSEPGHGAEFRFTLPLRRGGEVALVTRASQNTGLASKGEQSGASAGR